MAVSEMAWFLFPAAFVFGSVLGSFLNVCIHRIPEGASIVRPRSHCPACGTLIRWYDNIPILSFLILGARCRSCGARILIRYPAVELLTGLFAVVCLRRFGPGFLALQHFIFTSALIVITFIDLQHMIIPDVISLPGIALGVGFTVATPYLRPALGPYPDAVLGAVLGGGILWSIAALYQLVRKQEGMGFGDVKLLAMIGAYLGWQSLFFVILMSSFVGAVLGCVLKIASGKDWKFAIPFGPFLALGALGWIFLMPILRDMGFYVIGMSGGFP